VVVSRAVRRGRRRHHRPPRRRRLDEPREINTEMRGLLVDACYVLIADPECPYPRRGLTRLGLCVSDASATTRDEVDTCPRVTRSGTENSVRLGVGRARIRDPTDDHVAQCCGHDDGFCVASWTATPAARPRDMRRRRFEPMRSSTSLFSFRSVPTSSACSSLEKAPRRLRRLSQRSSNQRAAMRASWVRLSRSNLRMSRETYCLTVASLR
jgi:hypothetical protein